MLAFLSRATLAALALITTAAPALAQDFCFGGTPYPVGSMPSDVAIADLSGDGVPDLTVANHEPFSDNRISVLINHGDGSFAPTVFYDVGERPYWLAISDLNGDGWNDVVVTNYFGASVSVLINEGGGTLAPHVLYSTGNGPTFLALAYMDLDGALDLVVSNGFDGTVSVLMNNGDGTFGRHVDYPIGFGPYGVAAADYNNDGYTDVAAADYLNGEFNTPISVLMNNGDGTLGPQTDYYSGPATVGLTAADFDNDGFNDLVAANPGWDATSNTLSVFHNNGDGTFSGPVDYVVGIGVYDVAATDFNFDGFVDLATGNEEGSVSVLINNMDGTFGTAVTFPAGAGALGVATGDLDGNGTPEIATACYSTDEVWVLFNSYVALTLQPVDVATSDGGNATFEVGATGPGTLGYQWRHDGVDLVDGGAISGATSAILTIDPVDSSSAGNYDVIVTNYCGSLVSAPAALTVTTLPRCLADLNGDGSVGGADLAILLGSWGGSGVGDIDGNGVVNGADLGLLLGSWGSC